MWIHMMHFGTALTRKKKRALMSLKMRKHALWFYVYFLSSASHFRSEIAVKRRWGRFGIECCHCLNALFLEIAKQITDPSTSPLSSSPLGEVIQSDSDLTTQEEHPLSSPSFSLSGKPFLRAIFRSLEVGPGTDYDTFFALSLLISIKLNGGWLSLFCCITLSRLLVFNCAVSRQHTSWKS